MEDPGQGQAGGRGPAMLSAHTQACWPPALVRSPAGMEAMSGRLGQWGRRMCLSLQSAESRCQAHGSSPETHPGSLDSEPTVCQPWG